MRVGQLSHKGNIRPNNEDNVYSSRNRNLFIIADGMGGHQAGEVASRYAINKVKRYIKNNLHKLSDGTNEDKLKLICNAISHANKSIIALSKKDSKLTGMGTTIITVLIQENTAFIGHVGDSRAYIINKKSIKQITKDHSLVEELFRNGSLKREEVEKHPHKNIITRALGGSENVLADTYTVSLQGGDTLLLCTDGLSNMVSDDEILKLTISSKSPQLCAKTLVETANLAGGIDNISVIVIKNIE